MNIKIDKREIISLKDFELGWRFDKIHNSKILETEKNEIFPLSQEESRRLNKVIDFFEIESNRFGKYSETDWFSANAQNDKKIEKFRLKLENYLKLFDEDLIISWERKVTLKTSKEIFLKYWTDFLYLSSDDVTIISENTNWILFYNHVEVANLWIKNNFGETKIDKTT